MITLPSVEHDATYSPEWSGREKKLKKGQKRQILVYSTNL